MGDCENILGDWGWLGVTARFSKAQIKIHFEIRLVGRCAQSFIK